MKKTISSLLNYIGCIGMALFVTFIIEGTIGMVLTFALVIALILSILMTLLVKHSISIESVLSSCAVNKGDEISLEIKLKNKSIIPSSIVTVEIEPSAHFTPNEKTVLTGAVTGKGVNTIPLPLTANHSGKAHIYIKSVKISDFLGIFNFKIKQTNFDNLTVSIYPNIPDATLSTSIIKTATNFSNEDDDEESEETSRIPTGLAGYDHREYIPGDPIKRINWKMSSKRDILMVRLDEKIKGSGHTFLLDCPKTPENEISLTVRDNVIEGAVAMLCSLIAEGSEASIYYCKQNLWMSIDIHTMADIYTLREELSDFEPSEKGENLPTEIRTLSKTPICFTSAMNGNFSSLDELMAISKDAMIISSHAAALPTVSQNQWVLSENFEVSRA